MKRIFFSLELLLLLALSFVSTVASQSPVSIKIVEPIDRRNVPVKNAPVTVEISGIAPNRGYYWELWVDEEPIVGVRDGATTVLVPQFEPTGPHRLKAVLFDAQGNQVAVSNGVLVLAAPVQDRTPQFNRERMAPIMGVFALLVTALIIVSVWFNRKTHSRRGIETESNTG